MKPRNSGIFTPGTNMAVHRADQSVGQGSAGIPSYRLTPLTLVALPEPAPRLSLPWSIGMGTSGQGQETERGSMGWARRP